MKIASYNILSGGFTSYSFDSPFPERLELLKKAIKTINADFIGLIDTFRWDSLYSTDRLKQMFGYKHAYCINLNDVRMNKTGVSNGLTVLSNIPVFSFETIRLHTRDAVKTTIKIDKKPVDIFTVYLDDLSEKVRVKQTQALLQYVDKDKPTIIMGDLNTLSVSDLEKTNIHVSQFIENNPKTAQNLATVFNDMKRGEVVTMLKKNGFSDADEKGEFTFPTKLFPIKTQKPIVRIDYLFYSKYIILQNFKVYKGKLFDSASDHFPISFEWEVRS